MLVDEMPRSFVKKNNSYSHCPLKKRPVHVMLAETELPAKTEIKEELIEVVDEIPEPENLSTKPEDLSRGGQPPVSGKRSRSPSPAQPLHPQHCGYPQLYPSAAVSPPAAAQLAPVHPVAKKARVEVLQHDQGALHPLVTPLDYPSPQWPRQPAVLYPQHYLAHYPAAAAAAAAYRYHQHQLPHHQQHQHQHHPHHQVPSDLYPAYPLAAATAAYPHSAAAAEHQLRLSPSPPLRPLGAGRPYASHWLTGSQGPVSPTGSLGSAAMRSPPPPVSPEDLSSPGSDSGRSSAGSTSTGVGEKPGVGGPGGCARYQCPDCAKSYSTYSGLSKHQQFHCAAADGQPKKSFTCKYCEKVYLTLGALKMHIRTHTLPCKCHLCGKAFSRPWLLQGHIRTHTGEKPFSCQHCNRAFADRSNLRAHLQTHSDVKKYSCSSCSKTFSRMSLLTKHQEGGCPGVALPIGYSC